MNGNVRVIDFSMIFFPSISGENTLKFQVSVNYYILWICICIIVCSSLLDALYTLNNFSSEGFSPFLSIPISLKND